jgi:hypothetical protein
MENSLGRLCLRRDKASRKLPIAQKWVIGLGLLTLMLGLGNLGRAVMALRYAARLPNLPLTAPLSYLAAMGSFWFVVFAVCAVGLVGFCTWGRRSALAAVTFYQAHVWVNHLLFDASDYARQTRPRDLVLSLLLLALFWGSLNLREIRRTFVKENEL